MSKGWFIMKIKVASLVALAASATLGAPAMAGDFSGPRIEAVVGWDNPRAKVDLNNARVRGHDSGVVYGGEAGYDLRFGPIVAGALVGIDGSSAKHCGSTATFTSCLKQGRDWAVGARAGFVVTPKTLLYGKAEYVNVRLSDAFSSAVDTAANFSTHDNRGGYRLGAGVEVALTSHVYIKGEYRYSDYKHQALANGADIGTADLARNQVVGGVGLRF